jgi:hypothetical protein
MANNPLLVLVGGPRHGTVFRHERRHHLYIAVERFEHIAHTGYEPCVAHYEWEQRSDAAVAFNGGTECVHLYAFKGLV